MRRMTSEMKYSEIARRLQNLHGTMRQRLQEGPPVGLGHDSVVKHDDNAAIALGADEPANALAKLQDRFRERILSKRIAARA